MDIACEVDSTVTQKTPSASVCVAWLGILQHSSTPEFLDSIVNSMRDCGFKYEVRTIHTFLHCGNNTFFFFPLGLCAFYKHASECIHSQSCNLAALARHLQTHWAVCLLFDAVFLFDFNLKLISTNFIFYISNIYLSYYQSRNWCHKAIRTRTHTHSSSSYSSTRARTCTTSTSTAAAYAQAPRESVQGRTAREDSGGREGVSEVDCGRAHQAEARLWF